MEMTDKQKEELRKERLIIRDLNCSHTVGLFSYLNNELKARFQMLDLDIKLSDVQWIDWKSCKSLNEKNKLKIIEDRYRDVSQKAVKVIFTDDADKKNEIVIVPIAENLCLVQTREKENKYDWITETRDLNYQDLAAWIYVRYKGRMRNK